MKTRLIFSSFLLVFLIYGCQKQRVITTGFHEPSDPDSLGYLHSWDSCPDGLQAGFVTTGIRLPFTQYPAVSVSHSLSMEGWRGERTNGKIVIWSKEDVSSVRVTAAPLTSESGSVMDTTAIRINPVGYVLTDAFLTGCGRRDKDTIAAHLSADILYGNRTFNIPGQSVRPIWISVDIPATIPAGIYSGIINVSWETDSMELPLQVTVQDLALPSPTEWAYHLDLWQNPFSIARVHDVPLWSDAHWQLITQYRTMLADAGQKCITTSIVDHPWGGQTFDPFQPMIGWLHNSSGKWDYDYSVFDQYVETAMDAGITEQINCYTMVPWKNRFTWFEEDSSGYITRVLLPGSTAYEALWQPFLWDFREHLRERGWLNKTTIAMDERNHDQMAAQLAFLKRTAPEFKITLAGHYYPDLMPSIYDFSYNWHLIKEADPGIMKERRADGMKTTFYVACGIPDPNTFTFSPPSQSVSLGWVAAAFGFDGFLRWAYNSWPPSPLTDSRFITWPAGDTYLVYPGPCSSVRFEKLREGIQDYEKIRILSVIINDSGFLSRSEPAQQLYQLLDSIRHNPGSASLTDWVTEGKKYIRQLSED